MTKKHKYSDTLIHTLINLHTVCNYSFRKIEKISGVPKSNICRWVNGIINYELIKKSFTSISIYNYLERLIKANKISNKIFLMDNASIHKGKKIQELMEDTGNELLFIPAYSPEYNPIEMVFSNLKSGLRNNVRTEICKKFENYIPKYIKKINKTNYIETLYKKSLVCQ